MSDEAYREEVEKVVGFIKENVFVNIGGITDFKDSIFFRDKN